LAVDLLNALIQTVNIFDVNGVFRLLLGYRRCKGNSVVNKRIILEVRN